MLKIKYLLITKSNCLIGNQTQSFSVGGVDQATTIDEEGYPMIPGSAIKGALRTIVQENGNEFKNIVNYYISYFKRLKQEYKNCGKEHLIDHILFSEYEKKIKPEYIFGIPKFSQIPSLYFSDLYMSIDDKDKINKRECFLIDTKTSIQKEENGQVISNPRTYKVIKPGITFKGEIYLKGFSDYEQINSIKSDVEKALLLFNENFYSLGNSKSRGYGRIWISIGEKENGNV